jgi:hypothetical protein
MHKTHSKKVLAIGGLLASISGCLDARDVKVRLAETPEPKNIQELKRGAKVTNLTPCQLPTVSAASDSVQIVAPDEFFEITLPGGWSLIKIDSLDAMLPDLRATLRNSKNDYIIVIRRAREAIGLPYMMNAEATAVITPASQCEVTDQKAGSLLSFYGPSPNASRTIRYRALGEGVTPQGKRYGIELVAGTAADLDTIAALVTRAILTGRKK